MTSTACRWSLLLYTDCSQSIERCRLSSCSVQLVSTFCALLCYAGSSDVWPSGYHLFVHANNTTESKGRISVPTVLPVYLPFIMFKLQKWLNWLKLCFIIANAADATDHSSAAPGFLQLNLKPAVHIFRSLSQLLLACRLPLQPCGVHSSAFSAIVSSLLLNTSPN